MATPHNTANEFDFAKTVLMPGDPLRSRYIAEHYLEEPRLVNNVRGMQGYTGTYKGKPVSVMASGMGIPSMGIYSYELFHNYHVDNIIRIGSAGALSGKLKLRDVVAGIGACTDSNYGFQFGLKGVFAPVCDYSLLSVAVDTAEKMGINLVVGNLYSTDAFYDVSKSVMEWGKMGVLASDMEAAGLYYNAAYAGKRALTLCSISDHLVFGEALNAEDRQLSFNDMIRLALEAATQLERLGDSSKDE